MFSRRSDWLSTRVDKWVSQCQGYSKLRSRRLSRGCQTMLDRPLSLWGRQDPGVSRDDNLNINISSLTLTENTDTGDSTTDNFYQKQFQYDQDIANYISYLNKPVINMNDHYIEIHQYHYDASNFPGQQQDVPVRPPTRRKKHRIDVRKTQIVENKGLNTVVSPEYSEFLVKKETDLNRNIRIVSGRSSDEENKQPEEELDLHRPLEQKPPGGEAVDTVINKEGLVRVQRNQTFSTRSSASDNSQRGDASLRGFLSFRTTRKNISGRRKRVVVGEKGLEGPIWPAVLLTFDRSVSPSLQGSPDESQV